MTEQELRTKLKELKYTYRQLTEGRKPASPKPKYGWYTKNRKTYQYEMTESEAEEYAEHLGRVRLARFMQEKDAKRQHKVDHMKGYCPVCHLLIPIGHDKCPDCE